MRVMVIGKANKDSEAGVMPKQKGLEEMGRYNEELVKAGILVDFGGLHPSSKGKRVRLSGNKRSVIDGPFTEAKELIAGYMIWQVRSIDEAVEWVKRAPNPEHESEVEIRPIFGPEDFGDELTPEMKERGQRLRAEIGAKK